MWKVLKVILAYSISLQAMFHKPVGFSVDGSHRMVFRELDSDRDGLISDKEMYMVPGMSQDLLNYIKKRRTLNRSSNHSNPQDFIKDGISPADFMWFYRESDLFLESPIPDPPSELYSFPSWPGMRSVPCATETRDITPERFWADYVLPHRAVIIRGALNGSVAVEKWHDPEYLIASFGDMEAKVENRYESRGEFRATKSKSRAKVSEIVRGEVDGYIVSVVPQKMAWEVNVPKAVLCGLRERSYLDLPEPPRMSSLLTELEETSLWISRGPTRSQFHYDKENTLNCLVTGVAKKWVILDTRKYGRLMPWVREGGYDYEDDTKNRYTDWVGINVDELDLNLHKYLTEVEFEVVEQHPGDCVFLPYSMLHYAGHLTSDPNKLQVAVSYMWLPRTRYNSESCEEKNSNFDTTNILFPLALFDTVWYYSGYGAIPQGHHDPRGIENAVLRGPQGWSPAMILPFLPEKRSGEDLSYVLDTMHSLAKIVDKCRQRGTRDQECHVPADIWLHLSTAVDLNRLGCNSNLTYIPRPLKELNRMLKFFDQFDEK